LKIFDGFEEVEISPWQKCVCAAHLHFSSRLEALLFLQRYKANTLAMMSLRRMVREGGYDAGHPVSDDEVLERVAARLAAGELHLLRKLPIFGTGAAKKASQEPRMQAAPLPPPSREAQAAPAPPPDDPVFLPDVDPVVMAQALTQASQDGKPFCEE